MAVLIRMATIINMAMLKYQPGIRQVRPARRFARGVLMAFGPILIFDKSTLQSLNPDEACSPQKPRRKP